MGDIRISRPHNLLGRPVIWFPQKTEPSPSTHLLEAYFYWEGICLFITGKAYNFLLFHSDFN